MSNEIPVEIELINQEDNSTKAVAKLAGEKVGEITLQEGEWSTNQHGIYCDTEVTDYYPNLPCAKDLIVKKEYRKRGVATQLMSAIEELARQQGHNRIGLGVDINNQPAISLYEKLGYEINKINGNDLYEIQWDTPQPDGTPPGKSTQQLMIKELE
jgi:ribosomal protein S18 acetylase RimI-like enzyme